MVSALSFLRPQEQRVLDHDARRGVGHVGVLALRGHVARGVDAPVGGLQAVVTCTPVLAVVGDAGRLEVQPLDVGHPPDPRQDLVHRHRRFLVVVDQAHALLAARHGDALDARC